MKIVIETIPHDKQRYTTCGDWWYRDEWERPPGTEMGPKSLWIPIKVLEIRVSKLSDPKLEKLVAIHELIEALCCEEAGITQEQVDAFDKAFGDDLKKDAGDDPNAPYRKQHSLASGFEQILAAEWNVDWQNYLEELSNLPVVPCKI